MRKQTAPERAHATGRWAEILFRALSTRVAKRWRFVSFRGGSHGEWRGIVDVVAIRKDAAPPADRTLKRGDLFEIVLVQIKGGSSRLPSESDRRRLRAVARIYRAKEIVLFQWRRGEPCEWFRLGPRLRWTRATGSDVFG